MEIIRWQDEPLTYIIPAGDRPDRTEFITTPEICQQVGFVVYPAGGEVRRHLHRSVERHLEGTSEVLFVRRGRCEIDIFSPEKQLVATRQLQAGDLVVLIGGGHGLRMLEDTILLEIKPGPYLGAEEKELF